jgi:membrane-associated protease RseP (regulator of RpoE activity)
MLPPVAPLLFASTYVVGQVGDRVGAHGSIEAPAGRPYITWQVLTGVPENNLSEPPDIDRWSVQVNILHPTDAGVRLLAAAARAALEAGGHVTGVPVDSVDEATGLYWIALQADLWAVRND